MHKFLTTSGSSNNIDMYNIKKYNKNVILAHKNDKKNDMVQS